MRLGLATLLVLLGASAAAAELTLFPRDIPLTGPHASQRLLVLSDSAGKVDGDLTGKARFTSSNPAVAKVDDDGTVRGFGYQESVSR